jgi:hypothetical protein
MARRPPHVHKYLRIEWGKKKTPVMRCVLPNCTHYVHMEMVLGRQSICWKCGAPFVIDRLAVTRKKPKCYTCVNRKDQTLVDLDELLGGLD